MPRRSRRSSRRGRRCRAGGARPPTGLVRRCQARHLPGLGPVLGAGVGAPGGRHPTASQGERSRRDVAGQPLCRVVPQHQPHRRQPHNASFDTIQDKKWELTRGVGHSFGANSKRAPRGHRDGHRAGPLVRRHRLEERQPADRHRPRRARPSMDLDRGGSPRPPPPRAACGSPSATARVYAVLLDVAAREFGIRGVDPTAFTEVRILVSARP
jgi:hypothetical protein